MILVKKKRIAIDRKRARNNIAPQGLWGRISSVTQRPPGAESIQFENLLKNSIGLTNKFLLF